VYSGTAREVDVNGHGTHVMGIIGGDGSLTGGAVPEYTYAGMAPMADLIFVKTTMYTTDILDGVNYIFEKATALGKNAAVNLSPCAARAASSQNQREMTAERTYTRCSSRWARGTAPS
jgi:subtilisin family serine protease